jgi:hypothetical protein
VGSEPAVPAGGRLGRMSGHGLIAAGTELRMPLSNRFSPSKALFLFRPG